MVTSTLIEIIFKGVFSTLNISFLSELLFGAKEIRFNLPELSSSYELETIIKIFNLNSYVDLVITTDKLNVNGRDVKNVFVNIGRNDDDFDLLFYFDIKDLDGNNYKLKVDHLKTWANNFCDRYNFNYFIGQMDNANDEEYYFDSNGIGPLYDKIGR
ncbi:MULTISPECIES: hypothetical protein [Sphingobacterium]|uniref:Uncharacterized protein n=1 Tax=Sphingobacterium athyrii TaxID=2152717 RepID=A0A363NJT0_9SPHI|nr:MULTISPECIES: hypothetical protein [Sphingobacterium]PUV21078.1 hypothetical protein DCO56_28865 [Sphingobacterium athyrii]QIH34416.1 hypothetical protein G6053_16655 [Sphingobacterium sp. DR205]